MVDYFPALARAVSSLPDNNAQARQELYEHARTILVEQLRRQYPQKSEQEIVRERAMLETALHKVEAESLSTRTQRPNRPSPPRLMVVVEHDGSDIGLQRERLTQDQATAQSAIVRHETIDTSKQQAKNAAFEMGEMPTSLGAMLIRTAFIAGMIPFIGMIYIRGRMLVSENVISYPVLLVATAVMLGLLLCLPLAIIRKAQIASGVGFFLGLTSSVLRRGF
jgi:uncharacterized membrane protein YraQ (UPF0718 family)